MSFNIMDLVKNEISSEMKGQMGSLLGSDSSRLDAGMASAVPGLLKGLTQRASVPGGADKLLDAVRNQDDGLLDNIGSSLGGNGGSSLLDGGVKALTGLFGESGLGSLGGIISQVSGMSTGGSRSLLGLLAPIVMGVLKRKVTGGGLNASGLLSMLNEQDSNVKAAMPAGMSQAFDSSSLLDDLDNSASSVVSTAAGTASSAASAAADGTRDAAGTVSNAAANAVDNTSSVAAKGSSGLMKYLPLAGLALLALIALKFCTGGDKDVAEQSVEPATTTTETASEATELDVAGLETDFSGVFDNASSTLEGITDVDSATASVPALTEMADKFGGLAGSLDEAPEAARESLSGILSTGLESLMPLLEKLRAIPGVGDIIDPIIQPVIDTLQKLAG